MVGADLRSSHSEEVAGYWKQIIVMLSTYVQRPKLIKSKFRLSFGQILTNLEEKPYIFCPDNSFATETDIEHYQDFLSGLTNCLLILLTKDMDHTKVPGISPFYEKLLKLLYLNCGELFQNLMVKLISSLMTILDVYLNPVGFYPTLSVGTFSGALGFPSDCTIAVKLGSLESAKPVVSLLTDVIFSSYKLVLQSPLKEQIWQLMLKRLDAWHLFKYDDLVLNDLLASFPFQEDVSCIPRLAGTCVDIIVKTKQDKDGESLLRLHDQVAQIFLKPYFPIHGLANQPFPSKLKGIIMNHHCDERRSDNQSSLIKLLCNFLNQGVVYLSDFEIKWLAHKFSGPHMVPGYILLAYLETELRQGIHNRQNCSFEMHPANSNKSSTRILYQNAEDFSKVWQILQSIFSKKLDKLAQMEDEDQSSAFDEIEKLHLILNGLQAAVGRIKKEHQRSVSSNLQISFCFFPLVLGKIVAQMGVLPRHCIETTPSSSKLRVNAQRELTAWSQILDMLNALRMLPDSAKLELSDLNNIEVLCGLPWLTIKSSLDVTQNKIEWYQVIADALQKDLKASSDGKNQALLKTFVQVFNNTKIRPTPWRVQVVKNSLSTLSDDSLVLMLQSIPILISSCRRDDIQSLYAAFKNIRSHQDGLVTVAAAEILSSVVCALSGCCEVQEYYQDGKNPSSCTVSVKVSCSECTKNNNLSGPRGWNFLNLLDKFTDDWKMMIEHKNVEIRRAVAARFPQIVKHLGKTFTEADIGTWLKLLNDDDSTIAADFAMNLPTLLNLKSNYDSKENVADMIVTSLHSLIDETWKRRKTWNTVFCALDPLLKVQSDSLVKPIMKIVVKLIALRKEDVCGLNKAVIEEFLNINLLSPMVLFFQSQDEFWSVVIETFELQDPSERSVAYCFQRICNVFNFKPQVLNKHLFHFLKFLVPKCSVDLTFLHTLNETASYMNCTQQSMLKRWHAMLYPMFLVKHPECVDFYLKLAECDDDIDRYLTLIVIQVIINCHTSTEDIFEKLSDILKDSDAKPGLSPDEVSQHLQKHMLGILHTFQINVLNKYASTDLKLRSLVGFTNMLSFMSKEAVSQFYSKILDVLCTFKSLDEPALVRAYCSLVLTFLEHLESDKIGPVMFTVLTNVTFLDFKKYRSEAKAILDFFLTRNKPHIKPNAYDLFNFVDLLEEFKFNSILHNCQKTMDSMACDDMLEEKLKAISNSYVESQVLALIVLKKYLEEIQPEVQEFLFSHKKDCLQLNAIIGKLIAGVSSSNRTLRVHSIECLSELGAIDPSHWIMAYGFKDTTKFFMDSSSAEFVCQALETLLDVFQSSTKKEVKDVIGYVCQEFMKANHFQDEPAKAPVQIWNQFSEQTKSMLMPFFTSNYFLNLVIAEAVELPHPLFGTQCAETFEQWIFHWAVRLISFIKNKTIRDIFDALKLVFKINMKNIHFFLPHIFTHALWASEPEQIDMIVEEMMAAAHLHEHSSQLSEEESFEVMFRALGQNFDMQSFVDLQSHTSSSSQNEMSLKCSKMIFFLIDYITHWNLEYEQAPQKSNAAKSRVGRNSSCSDASFMHSANAYKYKINKKFIARFNMKVCSEQNHVCNENFRALRLLDMHCIEKMSNVEDCLNLFLRIHSQLQNSDFVHGVSSLQTGATSKSEQLLLNEMNGQLQESIIWYEKMLLNREGDPHDILCCMTKAYLQLEQYQPVLGIFQKYFSDTNSTKFNGALIASKLETHWRTGEWEKLHEALDLSENCDLTWASYFAKILDSIFHCDLAETTKMIAVTRGSLGSWLNQCGANSSSYATNYPAFLLMHLLTDVEIFAKLLHPSQQLGSLSYNNQLHKIQTTLNLMELRQKRISYSWKGLQLVLSVRRTLLSLLQHTLAGFAETDKFIRKKMGQLWIESAEVSMNQRQFPQALGYLISSEQCGLKETFVLQAQLEWERGAKELALIYLHRGIKKHFLNAKPGDTKDENLNILGKAKLLVAEYSWKMRIVDATESLALYKAAVNCYSKCEEAWIYLARAYDVVNQNVKLAEEKYLFVMKEIVKCYSHALQYGVKHVYESLPRIITIWANNGAKLHELDAADKNEKNKENSKVNAKKRMLYLEAFNFFNGCLKNLKQKLPKYAFYACFNSLSSRLCNPYKPVYSFIHEIFIDLLQAHPYQMLWKLAPMIKVSHHVRVNRIQAILIEFGENNDRMTKLMDDYVKLNTLLYDLGHLQIKSASSRARMSDIAPRLVAFFKESRGSKILMPTDDLMSVVLPLDDSIDYKSHNAFPRKEIFITGVREPVTIISSLQKPKKFTFMGSDGLEYSWLLKNKVSHLSSLFYIQLVNKICSQDDLRIDSTVMHFMQALNALLDQSPECKERRLSCKTYSVVPLGEGCGLIEFVPNLITMRQVIMTLYQGKGEKCDTKEEIKKNDNIENKRKIFEKHLIPANPPVLSDWFHWKFPDHSAWNEARKKFIHSTAVMSVVGYILGLGDRHGGNITLDNATGESIHVDYNCIFNKGETLPWPEKVPFRLTHNMIKAMGIAGMEGPYRKAVELTLGIMRNNVETLIGVLRPIMFDATNEDRLSGKEKGEFYNVSVEASLKRVKMRLDGILDVKNGKAAATSLSPEGQAKAIIAEATDVNNLCQMYPGWGAFL